MNIKPTFTLILGLVLLGGVFTVLISQIHAVSIAEQTQGFDSSLNTWQIVQELGNNLSGQAAGFTFRVSTSASHLDQFDYTAQNSRLYDKDNNNSYIIGCIPSGASQSDPARGLSFTTTGVPAGFEDVSIDFSCRNYDFISGHRYLILISNANMPQWGGKRIRFAAASYKDTANDYFIGGGVRYAFDNAFCYGDRYVWNSQSSNNGCNIFTTAKDDLYFVLSNTSLPPKVPVIFIPGIGGSEFKATENIFWADIDDGHGGKYSHAYSKDEKIWVNQDKAAELGDDDYFDILRLKADGQTSEASLSLTGDLTPFGYPDLDSFFSGMGYIKGTNYFSFPYDWRKDVRGTKDSLDLLIEQAQQKSGQTQVNLVVHSMGGLVGRYYISDSKRAVKVNKLIELGVPHLGATHTLKTLMYGTWLARDLYLIKLGIVPTEVKDVFQNLVSGFQLLPSKSFFNFYDNSNNDLLYPFRDDRDIDNDKITGSLNFDQTKNLLTNLGYNMTIFNMGEQFHDLQDSALNQTNGTKVYEIIGTAQPTLGQIQETWWITWPINLIPKTDEIFINGDGTVPLYSASLKNDLLDTSGATKIYYVEQEHGDLVSSNGPAMQTVKSILNDDSLLPVEVKDQKITLEGQQLSLDDGELDLYDDQNQHCGLNDKGEMEENIPDVTCTTSGNTKHAFVKKKAKNIKVTITRKKPAVNSKTITLKTRTYTQDKVSKTTIYKDLTIDTKGKIEFDLDPAADTAPSLTFYPDSSQPTNTIINPTSEASGGIALDQVPPKTSIQVSGTKDPAGIYTGPVTVTLTGSDIEAGILKIEYSLDNGQTVQTYTEPFVISTPGQTTVQVKSIDKLGNEEIPQAIIIEIAVPSSPSPAPTPTPSLSPSPAPSPSPSLSPSPNPTSASSPGLSLLSSAAPALATNTSSPNPFLLPIRLLNTPSPSAEILGISSKNPAPVNTEDKSITQIPRGLLIVFGDIVLLVFVSLIMLFPKPAPK